MSTKMRVFYGDEAGPITEANEDTTSVVFIAFDDDKEVARLTIDGNDLPSENQQRAYLYGVNKLLTDRTSEQKDKVAKLDDMQEVFDLLVTGEWAKERTVGAVVVSCEVEALAKLQSLSIPDTQAALAAYNKETRAVILANPQVVEMAQSIREYRKEKAPASLDEFVTTE